MSSMSADRSSWSAEQLSELELIHSRKRALESELLALRSELESLEQKIKEVDLGAGVADPKDRLWLNARYKFNHDPAAGIAYLIGEGLLDNSPESVGDYLFSASNLRKRAIGKYFSSNHEFNLKAMQRFASKFNFTNQPLLAAFRQFLNSFAMMGESQVIERCIDIFAKEFAAQNPEDPLGAEKLSILCYACIMLNTALHNENARKDRLNRINSADDFMTMLERSEVKELDRGSVKEIYEDIRQQPFVQVENFQDLLHSMTYVRMEGQLYKQGGKVRTWKRRYCLLQGCRLTYLQDAHSNYPKGFILLRGLAVREAQDRSRSFCFELFSPASERIEAYKADASRSVVAGRHTVYKFSCQSQEEMLRWTLALREAIQEQQFVAIQRNLTATKQQQQQQAAAAAASS